MKPCLKQKQNKTNFGFSPTAFLSHAKYLNELLLSFSFPVCREMRVLASKYTVPSQEAGTWQVDAVFVHTQRTELGTEE